MILVGFGSSLPFNGQNPATIIVLAGDALGRAVGAVRMSRLYVSPAWPDPADPPFVNAVAEVSTSLGPEALLAALHAVEGGFGRLRSGPNAPRTLDLDLLDYEGKIIPPAEPRALELPHPGLAERDFVLAPLAEIAPGWLHPALGLSAETLLARLDRRSATPVGD